MKLEFDIARIEDKATAIGLQRTRDFIRTAPFLKGDWVFIDATFDTAGINTLFPHGLSFTPIDIIQTYTNAVNSVVFNYDLFDDTNLDIDVLIPCRIRFFAGRYTA